MKDVLAEARQELKAGFEAIAGAKQAARETWEMLAGPFRGDMLSSLQAAEAFLVNPDPRVRMAALLVLRDHWKPADFQRICEVAASLDGDEQVRNLAVISLGRFFKDTNDPDVGRTLARIVCNSSRAVKMRMYAYTGLFQVRGLAVDSWPVVQEHFTFPDDVDWLFVNGFLSQTEAKGC